MDIQSSMVLSFPHFINHAPLPEMVDTVGGGFIRPFFGLDKSSPYKIGCLDAHSPVW